VFQVCRANAEHRKGNAMITKCLLWFLTLLALSMSISTLAQEARPPIIDMHMHQMPWGPRAEDEGSSDWRHAWEDTKPLMDQLNVVLGLVSGPVEVVQEWQRLAPTQIVSGIIFPCDGGLVPSSGGRKCFENGESWPDIGWLRQEIVSKRIGFLGEITTQYLGLAPSDSKMEPYFALAEELDIPVAIHMGLGPPGPTYSSAQFDGAWCEDPCAPNFRASLSDPMLLEDVLIRHPRLRIFVMHAGWPMLENMINLLYHHPHVYVDISLITYDEVTPRKSFHAYLEALVDHGFGNRILWGIDSSDYNDAVEAIDAIESASFLTQEQKADIYYNNAARFLRLTEEQISAHHGR
jgi:hypothetical protein